MVQNQKTILFVLVAGAVMVLTLPLLLNDHWVTVTVTAFLWAYLCVCWNLVFGFSGQFSLGHALFWGIGGYTSTILFVDCGLTPWLGLVLGGGLASIVAFGISLIILRYRIKGIYFALMTMAIAAVAEGLVINWDYLRGPSGILLPLSNSPQNMLFLKRYPYYYIMLVCFFSASTSVT